MGLTGNGFDSGDVDFLLWFRRASVHRPPTPDADEDREPEPTLQEIINIKVDFPRLLRSELCPSFWDCGRLCKCSLLLTLWELV